MDAFPAPDGEEGSAGLGRGARARSSCAWLTPRSTRSIRRPALPAAPRWTSTAGCVRAAGARCASSSAPFASGSARRSSPISAQGLISPQRWPIRRCSPGPGPSRASRTARRASSSSAQIFRPRRTRRPMARWMARAGAELLDDADMLAPFRCTARGSRAGGSTRPPHWRPRFRRQPASRAT